MHNYIMIKTYLLKKGNVYSNIFNHIFIIIIKKNIKMVKLNLHYMLEKLFFK